MIRIHYLLLLSLITISLAVPAYGHANPVSYTPSPNQSFDSVDALPEQLSITFTERPELRVSKIDVLDQNNIRVDNNDLSISQDEKTTSVTIDKSKMSPGVFTVNWLVLSKDDGHITKGSYVFSISQNQQQGQQVQPSTLATNQSTEFTETATVDNTQIKLDISPLKVGENTFNVTVTDNQGIPIENIRNVYLVFNNPSKGLGPLSATLESQSPGHYGTTGSFLSQTGEWEVEVTVQRTDAYDVSHVFKLNLG
jgi:methionine-rich copper-binding protein CopC